MIFYSLKTQRERNRDTKKTCFTFKISLKENNKKLFTKEKRQEDTHRCDDDKCTAKK